MKISRSEVLHVSRLARIDLSEAEIERFSEQLSNILENFTALESVDTSGVPPMAQPIPLQNVLKPDEVAPSLSQEGVLANAPEKSGDYFKIRAVLD
jgi:aspartyl-tRNA(Asn)/glutamyl-tRNA(Gln) amidotransferase subunit C